MTGGAPRGMMEALMADVVERAEAMHAEDPGDPGPLALMYAGRVFAALEGSDVPREEREAIYELGWALFAALRAR